MPKLKLTPDQLRFAITALKARCVAPRANGNLVTWHRDRGPHGAKMALDWTGKQLQQLAGTYEPALVAGRTLVYIAEGRREMLDPPDRVTRALLERAIDELDEMVNPKAPAAATVH